MTMESENLVSEANKLRPKIHEMVTRHFEVRVYDKRKMMSAKNG